MNVQTAYNAWADTYDTVANRTRDLEAVAIRQLLAEVPFSEVIELGCGTGKNTEWLAAKAAQVTAVDFSAEMLARAQAKLASANVRFQPADVTQPWRWAPPAVDLVTCSLMLEHIPDLSAVFQQCGRALRPSGLLYVGELHPFKQYLGSKARYLADGTEVTVECHTHHLSDYLAAALAHGLQCVELREFFDADDCRGVPRIISFLFQKKA
ncbi:class I SAM-dependent methyltransferase [Hymenobacter armeniacus]|uniref:Methyltransferase domain-containing protein n=1 Tax=Hymenobacter armeniacus TaxID=2771358 RepID=A0ABR8JTB0_9BACT|nr:class I SAM-dependent methyltransferase [Hymenobacter armeniacus]MBD2721855.1 methyltransferase domain-containing protein [Hymenobacter armeniacus]